MNSDHLEEPGETPAPTHRASPDGWHWKLIFAMILGAIVVLLALVVLALYGADRNEKANASEQTLGDLASQVQAACTANPADARKVFGDVCGKAKAIDERPVGEKGDPGAKGDTGSQGPRGPAGAQGPIGPQGPPGPAGPRGPTGAAGQTPACLLLINACVGPTGETGAKGDPGDPGADSTVPGPKGDTGSQGPKGDAGDQGPKGDAGRGITEGPSCIGTGSDSYWLTKYSDGTEQRQDGPCRLDPLLPPATPPGS